MSTVACRHAVQVQFAPGGKKYHCLCPGACIGDAVKSPSWTSPATVVAYGATGARPPVSIATIVRRGDDNGAVQAAPFPKYPTTMNQNESPTTMNQNESPATMNTYDHGAAVEQIEQRLRAAKKAEKRERAAARERKRIAADRARLRSTALDALAHVAEHSYADDRTAAAVALLNFLGAR